jgi:hypothetical protein
LLLTLEIQQLHTLQGCTAEAKVIVDIDDAAARSTSLVDFYTRCFFKIDQVLTGAERSTFIANIDRESYLLTVNTSLLITITVVTFLTSIVNAYISRKSYQQYGWSVFETQGADLTKKRMLKRYHLFMVFLKINAYFFLGVVIQYVGILYFVGKNRAENQWFIPIIIMANAFVTTLYFLTGYLGARHTNYRLLGIYLGILITNFVALVVILYLVYVQDPSLYLPTRYWLTFFVIFQMITVCISYTFAILLMLDIKRGLNNIGNVN